MNVLTLLSNPATKAGTELSANSSTQALVEHTKTKVFLLHDGPHGATPQPAFYSGTLGLPAFFDGRSKRRPAGFGDAVRAVSRAIADWKVDVVHVHSVPRLSALRWLIDYCPTVVTAHIPPCPNGSRYLWTPRQPCDRQAGLICLTRGYWHDGCGHMGDGRPIGLPGFVRGMWLNARHVRLLGRAHRVVAISDWMMQRLVADGIPLSRVCRVPNPVLLASPEPPQTVPDWPPAVLFVGRAVDFKGADHLLEASARIIIPHRVWIAGGGAAAEKLSGHARRLGITDRVTFLGHIDPQQVADLYRRSTVVVVPSLWNEAFGRVGVEAMAAGRPVVGYSVGGTGDWLRDGITGLAVPVGNIGRLAGAIERVLTDPDAADRMGRAGADAAAAWTFGEHARALLPVLEEAVAEFSSPLNAAHMPV